MRLPSRLFALRVGILALVVATTAGLVQGLGRSSAATAAPDIGLPLFGVALGMSPVAGEAARAQAAGAGFAVANVDWMELEPTERGSDDPLDAAAAARLDGQLASLRASGIVAVAGVGGAPPWAAAHRNGPLRAGENEAYVAFLRKVVERYSGAPYDVRHWVLWSEADGIADPPPQWSDRGSWGDSPAAFAAVMRDAYTAVKQADRGAVVIMGPLAHDWFDDPGPAPCNRTNPRCGGSSPGFNSGGIFRYTFLDDLLDSMLASGGVSFDALGINAYISFAPGWEGDAQRNGRTGLDVAAKISHVRARLARHGVDVPIYVGESGFWSAGSGGAWITDGRGAVLGPLAPSPEAQAEYVAKLYARARSAGAAAVVWYSLDDHDPTIGYGLVDEGGGTKPAFVAYQWASRALGTPTRTMSPTLFTTVQGSVESYAFSGGTDNCIGGPCDTVVAWAIGSVTPTARVAAAPDLRVYNLNGAEVQAVGTDGDRYTYDLTASPVFFQRRSDYSTLSALSSRLWPGR